MHAPDALYRSDDEAPYVRCEVCDSYVVAPLGGRFCRCHRPKTRHTALVGDGEEAVIVVILVRRRAA